MRLEVGDDWNRLEHDIAKSEIGAWAKRIGVKPAEVHIRPLTRKWGSCSTSSWLSFNRDWRGAPAKIPRRVIVEDLFHLEIPDHGKLFKALVRSRTAAGRSGLPRGLRSPLPYAAAARCGRRSDLRVGALPAVSRKGRGRMLRAEHGGPAHSHTDPH